MPLIAQLDEALRAVDHAASQDFKWWFLGLLCIGLIALYLLARFFVERDRRLSNRLDKVQDEHTATLTNMNTQQATIIAENTVAYRELGQALRHIAEHLPEARHRLERE